MDWVETTGSTVAGALADALEKLGVDEHDADVVVVEVARQGFLGIGRREARVRARVRPTAPRPKRPQRGRRERGAAAPRSADRSRREATGVAADARVADAPAVGNERTGGTTGATARDAADGPARERHGRRRGQRSLSAARDEETGARPGTVDEEGPQMSVEQQAATAGEFVRGVVELFDPEATTSVAVDEDVVRVAVSGDDLGLLVGPRGVTLDALQELTRTVVQRRGEEHGTRIVVDVAGFRARRTSALESFVRRVAADVLASGVPEALEPMSASDRKVVHDTAGTIEGIETISEGVDPRRYVVIRPRHTVSQVPGES
jgi:spoIIIJ-associated protein